MPDYWREVFPRVTANAASLGGTDLLNTGPFAFEVKARKSLDLRAWMRQAKKNAKDDQYPTLIVRMNGQGEKSMDEWFVVMTQGDFKKLVKDLVEG